MQRNGFSLVELSIVLVILGLLTGGILAGRSLIRAAEVRGVSTELTRYKTAIYSFRDKYFYAPGDMPNASSFWGLASACSGSATPGTCNGDGNGKIGWGNEGSRGWQQLAMAGLVEGTYSGTGQPISPGVNLPVGRITNTGYALYWSTSAGGISSNTGDPNRLVFGTSGGGSGTMNGQALRPEEAWNLDIKMDDGLPVTGKLFGNGGATAPLGSCQNGTIYTLTDSGINCSLVYSVD